MNGFQEASKIETFSMGTSQSVIDYCLCSTNIFDSNPQMQIINGLVGTNHSMITL